MTRKKDKKMTWGDAIWTVLSGAKKPMSASKIWQEIDGRGLKASKSVDPAFLVSCYMSVSIRQEADGEESPYERVKAGEFRIKKKFRTKKKKSAPDSSADKKAKKSNLRNRIIGALEDERGAMHYTEIAGRINALSSSVSGTISLVIQKEGDKSPIVSTGYGYYDLRDNDEKRGLVKAFGMFWDAQQVNWKSTAPEILGKLPNDKKHIDFYNQKGVYVLHDGYRSVYVGQTTTLGKRLKEHTNDRKHGRWDKFSWFGFCPVKDDGSFGDVAETTVDVIDGGIRSLTTLLEGVLIEVVEPPLNRQQGKGLKGNQYMQATDEGGKDRKLAEDIIKMIKSRRNK